MFLDLSENSKSGEGEERISVGDLITFPLVSRPELPQLLALPELFRSDRP